MHYDFIAIPDQDIPRASNPHFQHLLDTYASETDKVISVWRSFAQEDMDFRPHPKSSTVADILKHQLLSERRFFGEFAALLSRLPATCCRISQSSADSSSEWKSWRGRG